MFFVVAAAAIALTCAMFSSRNVMLGFPCAIFWAVLGGYSYQHYVVAWDLYYLLFFSSMGMTIFSVVAMYGLRQRDVEPKGGDWLDSGRFTDEEKGGDVGGDGQKREDSGYMDEGAARSGQSRRSRELHERAALRRTGGTSGTKRWGEFK